MGDESPLVIDLDAVRAAHLEANPVTYRTLRLYGRDWRVRDLPNVFTIIDLTEDGSQVSFILGYAEASQRTEFEKALRSDEHLDEAMLEVLLNALTGSELGRPTVPSTSSDSSSQTDGTNSTADSSSEATQEDSPPSA